MEKNLEKSLKRYLKRKVKITTAFIVAFLLGSLSAYGEIEVKYENQKIKFYRNGTPITDQEELKKLGTITENVTGGFTWTITGDISEQIINNIKDISFNIINDGIISGTNIGINNTDGGKITKLANNGNISGTIGIRNENGTIEELTNSGTISGRNGIYNETSTIRTLTNNGDISGNDCGILNIMNSTIRTLTNNGDISGANNGINNIMNSTIRTLTNNGDISGKNGISNGTSGTIGELTNSGLISGKNGIYNDGGTISTLNNYGIIAGTNKAKEGYVSTINFGLLISGAGTANQTINAGGSVEQNVIIGYDENNAPITKEKYMINGVEVPSYGAIAEAIDSSKLSEKILADNITDGNTSKYFNEGKYSNLLINVVGDTNTAFNIDSNLEISNSTINGYKNAVALNGGAFTGDNITVNAGENAFIGSSSVDSINFSSNSIVNGNIDLGAEEDKIAFNTSTLNGNITADKDTITFDKSEINGELALTDGSLNLVSSTLNKDVTANGVRIDISGTGTKELFDVGSSVINGNITLTDGEISIADGTQINGKIELGGNTATVRLDKDQLLNDKVNITANEKNLVLDYNVNSVEDTSSMKKQVGKFTNLQLADGGNSNVDLVGITNLSTIAGGNGDDTFVMSPNNLSNIFINGNADNSANGTLGDILKLTTAVDSTTNVMLFKNVNNVETLQFADVSGNDLNINNSIPSAGSNLLFKNYVGGNKDDNFTVSIENFQKLSLIDGGANETTGDTLTINPNDIFSPTVTNIGENPNFDFNKIQNIENLEFTKVVTLNLNNLTSKYLQNLNIKLGENWDTIYISSDKLEKLKGLNGGNGYDDLIITNQITNENEDFSFLTKGDGTKGINLFEIIRFSENNDTINIDNLHKANNEIIFIEGRSGDDCFITSTTTLDDIKNSGNINGNEGKDTIKITDRVDHKTNPNVFGNVLNIEKLVLDEAGNNVLIDNLVLNGFNEIIGKDGGTNGNTFTIDGTDTNKKDKVLGMKIEGGSSINDKLIVNTGISADQLSNKTGIEKLELGLNKEIDYNIDFTKLKDFKNITSGSGNDTFTVSVDNIGNITIDGGGNTADGKDTLKLSGALTNKNALSEVSNIENLELDNEENILNLENAGFTNITGGTETDTFISTANGLNGKTLVGGAGQDTLEMKDSFDNRANNPFTKAEGIETLKLADVTGNIVNIDKLTDFTTITGGNQGDSFTIGNSAKFGITINGGTGNDSLTLDTSVDTSKDDLKNITGIENLTFNAKDNKLSFANADKNKFTSLSFGKDSTNNIITLASDLGGKNITFETLNETNKVSVDKVADVNGVKTFDHTVTNAGRIELVQGNSEWKFNDNTISGNTAIDLNQNSLSLTEKLSLGTNGKLSLGDVGFVSSGKVTLENGKIKVGLSDNVTFGKGIETLLSLESVGDVAFGKNTTLESYAFLNTKYNNTTKGFDITVKSWDEILGTGATEENKLFADTYDHILKEYYNQAKDTDKTITNAFNSFGSGAIAKYIENIKNHGLTKELVLNSESGTFESTVKGKVLIGTDKTNKGNDLIFKNISTNDFEINVAEGTTNNISLSEAVTLNNGIKVADTSKGTVNIALKGNTSVDMGAIDFGKVKGNLNIENTSKINTLGTITNGDVTVGTADTVGFNKVLASSNGGVQNINVEKAAKLEIKNDYAGKLSFAESGNNITLNKENYAGDINFANGNNTLTVSKTATSKGLITVNGETNNITVDGTLSKLAFTGNTNKNNVTVNGTLESGITFGATSSENKVTIGENGNIGKDIIFGTGAGDVFNLTSSKNQFAYNVTNADVINLNGQDKNWTFDNTSKITGDNVIVNLNDNGLIGFNIGKSDTGLVLGKDGVNPFANTGKYTINGNIKVTFDNTVTFTSLGDKFNVNTNILAGSTSKIIVPEFIKYNNKELSIKSAEELKSAGLEDYAFGNYEHVILNYNKKGYEGITSMLNNNSLTDISKVLNKGIDNKDHYFYSDSREIKDVATLGNINIQTSKDNQVTGDKLNTDIKFTNVTGKVANIDFAQGTTNSISFLDGVNLEKIDGSNSGAGFDLTLGKVNFTAKDETKITMSNFDDTLNINSTINDISVNTGAGNDTINISALGGNDFINKEIKVNLDGGDGEDIFNITSSNNSKATEENPNKQPEKSLSGTINSLETINVNTDVGFASDLKIQGTNTINIAKDKVLGLGIDFNQKDSNGKVIGHSLYNKGITVNNNDGNIMLEVAGTSKDTLISLGEKDTASKLANDKNLLLSGSSNHDISYDKANDDIKVTVKENIIGKDEEVKYGHLNKIYQSIVSADKIGLMAQSSTLTDKTKDEAIKAQLEFYGKIYHSTPYAYTHRISKKSTELITDSLILNEGMPELKSWRFGGSIAGREVENSENFYGNNYYNGVDVGSSEAKAETNIYGAYAFGEYGFQENCAVGFAVAGSKSDTDIGSSSLKGNNAFVSAYVKQDINNLSMIAGIGYQKGFYEAKRNVSNAYQSMSFEEDFKDDTFVGYFGAKYRYDLGRDFYLEPKGELRLTHSIQDDIKEQNNKDLSIEVDNKDFTSVDGELGLNLGKQIVGENGVLTLKAGVSLSYALQEADENMNARITGATKDFEIISSEEDRTKVNVLLKAEYQANNGMFYDVHYKTTTDGDDYTVGAGIGYKF